MKKIYNKTYNQIVNDLNKEIKTPELIKLLKDSLFYYCAGKDPSPVINYYEMFPMFVYSDSFIYMKKDYEKETRILYNRLLDKGFLMINKEEIKLVNYDTKATLSKWTKGDKEFLILYVLGDSWKTFNNIYNNRYSYIIPKCMCNIKYEMNTSVWTNIEKETEYILGHCYNNYFSKVSEGKYYGDYSATKISLYKRELMDI